MGRTSTDISVAVIGILNNILSRYTQSKFCGSRWTSHKEKYFPVWKDSKKKIYRPLFTISLTSKWLNKTAMSYVKTMNFTYCEMNFIICLLTSSETYAIHWTVYCCCLSTKKHCFPEIIKQKAYELFLKTGFTILKANQAKYTPDHLFLYH